MRSLLAVVKVQRRIAVDEVGILGPRGIAQDCCAGRLQGLASNTRLNGVSLARRKRLNPPEASTFRSRDSPAWAPKHNPTSCEREHGVHSIVENE
jgi:hypothetical protein